MALNEAKTRRIVLLAYDMQLQLLVCKLALVPFCYGVNLEITFERDDIPNK
jgi:hypothetical protein